MRQRAFVVLDFISLRRLGSTCAIPARCSTTRSPYPIRRGIKCS